MIVTKGEFTGQAASRDVPKLSIAELVSRLQRSVERISDGDHDGACAVLVAPSMAFTSIPGMGEN